MCVCMYVCMYVGVYVCMYVCMCVGMYVCASLSPPCRHSGNGPYTHSVSFIHVFFLLFSEYERLETAILVDPGRGRSLRRIDTQQQTIETIYQAV